MSRQPDRYTCAETLVHETQHLKLCALLDLVPLTRPTMTGSVITRRGVPTRRPASGLLQGAYAFLGVSGFWREQRRIAPEREVRQRAQTEFARWRDGAARWWKPCSAAGNSPRTGRYSPRRWLVSLDAWRREPVPDDARVVAQHMADRHRAQWHADNVARPAGPPQMAGGSKSGSSRLPRRPRRRGNPGPGSRRNSRSTSVMSASPDAWSPVAMRSRARLAAHPRVCGWVSPSTALSRGQVSSPMRRASSGRLSTAKSLARFMATVSVKW